MSWIRLTIRQNLLQKPFTLRAAIWWSHCHTQGSSPPQEAEQKVILGIGQCTWAMSQYVKRCGESSLSSPAGQCPSLKYCAVSFGLVFLKRHSLLLFSLGG